MGALKGWLIHRVTITFAVIALIVVGWNAYVAAHDDGILEGAVVAPSGEPVPDAEVVLSERTIVSLAPIAKTTTDQDGRFRFERHGRHALMLNASKPEVGRSGRVEIQLYFRNQNRELEDPVRLEPAG
jgi:Carboxypeptidase regulatory-like domain